MSKGAIYWAITKRKIVFVLMVMVMFYGLYTYNILPKQETPDVAAPVAMITTTYLGASSEDVERLVTRKIEDALIDVPGYDLSQSYSYNSMSLVICLLDMAADTDKAWNELRRGMNDVQRELPDGASDIVINTELTEMPGIVLSLSGEQYSYEQLGEFGEQIERELGRVSGISRFETIGAQEKQVRVEVDLDKLRFYSLTMSDIAGLLQSNNLEIPSGALESGETKINVKTGGFYQSLEDVARTVLMRAADTGAFVRLQDVATVQYEYDDSNKRIDQNGRNAVLLAGYFEQDQNIIAVGQRVEAEADRVLAQLPEGLAVDRVMFQPETVANSVNSFVLNLLEGVVIVILTVLVGMGLRNAVIVSTAIPFSILITVVMMGILHINIHQVSITALMVALGMLVDNAIVVSDAIQVRLDAGHSRFDACCDGTKEVLAPVFASTLTTCAAFIPLLMLPGVALQYISAIPLVVMVAVAASFLAAVFVTPALAYVFFRPGATTKDKTVRMRGFFNRLLNQGLAQRKRFLLITLAIFLLSLALVPSLRVEFMPMANTDMVYIDVVTHGAVDLDYTDQVYRQIAEVLATEKSVQSFTGAIGGALPRISAGLGVGTESADFAQLVLIVDPAAEGLRSNRQVVDKLQDLLDDRIKGATIDVHEVQQGGMSTGSAVELRLAGEDLLQLRSASDQVQRVLAGIDGVSNVSSDLGSNSYQFVVDIDRETAALLGLSMLDIQREINLALSGSQATVLRLGSKEYGIQLIGNTKTKDDLENIAIRSTLAGGKVLLKQVASINLSPETAVLKRYNRELTVTVSADLEQGHSSTQVMSQFQQAMEGQELNGARIDVGGEMAMISESFSYLGYAAMLAVFIVYIILMVQFNSLLQPLIIMLTVPLAVIGGVLGLLLFRQPLSFSAMVGMVSLLGVVVNNAIVLVDFINEERAQGQPVLAACRQAVEKRFRPVILSTTTTVIGLSPLVLSADPTFMPMAITVMSGLMVSTLLTLVLIPIIYSIVETYSLRDSRLGRAIRSVRFRGISQ